MTTNKPPCNQQSDTRHAARMHQHRGFHVFVVGRPGTGDVSQHLHEGATRDEVISRTMTKAASGLGMFVRWVIACIACAGVIVILGGCGGGGDDADEVARKTFPGPPDCVNRPELCI